MLKLNSAQGIVTVSFEGIVIDGVSEGEPLRGTLSIDAVTGGMQLIMGRPITPEGEALLEKVKGVFSGFARLREKAFEELERIDLFFDC